MKKRASKSPRAQEGLSNCDGSPPYPSNPPATGTIPGENVLNFVYYGVHDTAKGINDGQLVQHAMDFANGEQLYVFSLRGGPHKRRTLSKIELRLLLGTCTVVIENGPTTVLPEGGTTDLPAGSTFSFATADKAVLVGRSLTGPGLGEGRDEKEP